MAIQGFFTGDVKIRDLNGVLKAVNGIVEVATDAGTVTSVGLTVGSSGTDVNVANSPITTSGSITLNLPTASATNRGLLSSADWTTFNSKQGTITLTTTGSSGAATLIGTTLNIPNYGSALTGYVPYTGATTNVNLGEYGISSGYFQADLTPSGTLQAGRMQWNSTDGTMDLRLMGNNVTLQIGQEQVARVVNGTGGNLLESNYQAVKIIGAQGQRLQVGLARADSDANSKDTLGLVTENINNNQEGFITVSGLVNEIDTTGSLQGETWADGDTLYLSGTTSGAVTNVKPTAPTHTVIVGFVVYAHANHGKIFVKVDNGYELEELHDVAPTPYVNKGVLYRDTATNLWKSATIGTLLGYTPANAATTLTINGTAYDISANRTWNVGTVTSIGTSGPLTGGTITGSGTIGITQATTSTDGYLSSTDWNTFYNKQAAGSYITALTGEATASGPGSASVTLSTSAVTGKLLTGLNLTGGGTIAATDSILQAFGKVQNQISGLTGGVTYQGTWNASTNTPTLTSSVGTKGYYYIVDVAGSTNLNGITDWKVGDWAIFNGSTWDKVDNTDAVSSVNGFTGAVSLTTSNILEGTNLYYLDSRARLALSFTAGSGAYNNITGVITIPTNTSQLTNGANFITLSSLSASSPLDYNSGTGAFSIQVANSFQNGYLSSTDWNTFNSKQNTITLTTTGSSGSSTLVGATLNVPTYTLSGLGGVPTSRQLTINGTAYDLSADRSWSVGTVTGSGTTGYVSKWSSSTAISNSLLYDNGSAVLLGTATAGSGKFMVYSTTPDNHYQAVGSGPSFRFADTITSPTYTGIVALSTATNQFLTGSVAGDMVLANNTTSSIGNFLFGTGATERMRISPTGNVSINNTNNTYTFDVTGTVRFTGQLRLQSTITDGTNTYTLPSATGTLALTSQIPANPVTGTGTTNYLPKFTGTSAIGNSQIFDNGTNVGIGTASPGAKLTVSGGSIQNIISSTASSHLQVTNSSGSTYFGNDATGGYLYTDWNSPFVFYTNNSERMRLDASGNLGLGTTSPNTLLSLVGNHAGGQSILKIQSSTAYSSSGLSSIGFNDSDGSRKAIIYTNTNGLQLETSTTTPIIFNTNGNERMRVDASGNVGIGTSSPANPISFIRLLNISGGDAGLILSNSNGTAKNWSLGALDSGSFAIYDGSTFRFSIASTGAATFTSSVTTSGGGFIANMSTTNTPALTINRSSTSYNGIIKFQNGASDTWILGNRNTGDETFRLYNYNVGADVLTVTNSGSVGIGTTSPSQKLHIYQDNSNDVRLQLQQGTNDYACAINLVGNNDAGSAYNAILSRTGTNTAMWQIGGGGVANTMVMYTAGTERMRITSGGSVGIGTTSPNSLLNVVGNGAANGLTIKSSGNVGTYPFRVTWSGGTDGSWFCVNDSGNVGIGTSSPNGKLNISNGGAEGIEFWVLSATATNLMQSYNRSTSAWNSLEYKALDHIFYGSGSERMRITSGGQIAMNQSTTYGAETLEITGLISGGAQYGILMSGNPASYTNYAMRFHYTGVAVVGSITFNTTSTAYNTSSDYRLKQDLKDFSGLDLVSKLKAYDYEWKSDKSRSYGVIAHELQSVINYAVTGVKDGKEMQGVDYSKIVPVLIKAVQESHTIIKTLEERIINLEHK